MKNVRLLDKILGDTVSAIEQGKNQIFDIADVARNERDRLEQQIGVLSGYLVRVTEQMAEKEQQFNQARIGLAKVTGNRASHTEAEIEAAYEKAQDAQVELEVLREREQNIKAQLNVIESALSNLRTTVQKADDFVSQVGLAVNLLSGDIRNFSGQLDDMQQRQYLSVRIINAQEEERRRVARDIHDGPAQTLANVVLRVELAERLMDTDINSARRELRGLKDVVRRSLQDIRKVIYDLRPMTLDDLGLQPTLRRYVNDMKESEDICIDYSVLGIERRLPPHVEVGAFRIVQEALNNIVKHSRAGQVMVRIEFGQDSLTLTVEDDGIGFDLEEAMNRRGTNFGLLSMRERAELLEASWQVDSAPGEGARIVVTIPLKEEDARANTSIVS